MKINITDMDHLGNGIGKIDNKIVFVPKSIPGDICNIDIYKSHKKYDKGRLREIITASNSRIDARCPYYNECGGCNISNLSYDNQLSFKVNKVKNIFKKYLNTDIEPRIIESTDEYHYRNKITYHVNNEVGLVSEFDNVLNIDNCLLVSNKVNKLYNEIKNMDLSKVKSFTIRECDNGLILLIAGKMKVDKLKERCLSIYMDNKCVYHKDNGYITIGDIKYKISPDSFFQVNTSNIARLYDEIIRYADFNKENRVIDLYSGVGSISLYIAKYVKSVLGIEIVAAAVSDARENAKLNSISNAKFIDGDVSKLIDDNLIGDILIVDPPRIGLDRHTISVIDAKKIKKIIYVSCNPMTLVRDINLLTNYKLSSISVIDMFPQTHHVESIVLLSLKK